MKAVSAWQWLASPSDEDDGEGEEIEEYETRSLQAPRLPVLSGLQEVISDKFNIEKKVTLDKTTIERENYLG